MSEGTEGRADERDMLPLSGVGASAEPAGPAGNNESGAWERLVTLYGPLVEFWCRRGGLSPTDAEDVIQEVFAAAARGLSGF